MKIGGKMKNIIFDARMINHELHGIARYAYEIINRVSKIEGYKLILLVNDENLAKEMFGEKSSIQYILMKNKFLSLGEQIELPRILNKYSHKAIFHSPSYVSSPFIKIRSIMTIHDLNHLRFPQFYTPFHKYYYNYIVKPSANKASKILTVSNFSRMELLEWLKCNNDKIICTYNGIDEAFRVIKDKNVLKSVKEKYKLPDKFILYVGNQKPHKNLQTIIKSMKYIDDVKLVINGKGNEFINNCIKESMVEDKVLKIGFIEEKDLPKVYNLATVFVFPSLYEGFGLPPLEAMACGCPAIVSNASSLPEVVGEAGLKVDPLDDKGFADAINKVIKDDVLREQLICEGLERVSKYSWNSLVEDTIKIYDEVSTNL